MPKFSYKAKEGPGKIVDGVIEADNDHVAVSKIIQLGFVPIDIAPVSADSVKAKPHKARHAIQLFKKARLKDLVVYPNRPGLRYACRSPSPWP